MRFSISLLKSALQKAVRRNKTEKAVRVAKSLLEEDEMQFLRRWMVIILEDGLLHYNYDRLKEMVKKISKKGNRLTIEEKNLIINQVAEVAKSEWRDNWVDENEGEWNNQEEKEAAEYVKEHFQDIFKLPKKEQELVLAVKFRASIGGMKGDIVMLNHYFNIWAKRFLKKEWNAERLRKYFPTFQLEYERIERATVRDILIEAVDFHCSPLLPILMRKPEVKKICRQEYPKEDVEETLKWVIWAQRSSVDVKKEIGTGKVREWYGRGWGKDREEEKDKRIFNYLKSEIDSIGQWFLRKQLEKS